jgi:hypothetical protein
MSAIDDKYMARGGGESVNAPSDGSGSIDEKYMSRAYARESAPVVKNEDTSNWVDRVNAAGQGMSLGFADEAGSALAAGAAKLGGADESFGDIYSSMMESEKAKRDVYRENNAGEALALELAGGLVTGIAGGGRLMGAKALQNATKAKKLAALSALGAAEGGLGGVGTGDGLEDRVTRGATGAAIGGALPLAMAGAGKAVEPLINFVKKGRVDKALGYGDDFIPLNVADADGPRGHFYQDVVGEAFGGGEIRNQTRKTVQAGRDAVALAEDAVRVGKTQGDDAIRNTATRIQQETADEVGGLESAFRSKVIADAVPASTTAAERAALRKMNPQDANKTISKMWLDKGFETAKKQSYTLAPETLSKRMASTFRGDPVLRDAAGDFLPHVMDKFNAVASKSGKISGKNMMELRNTYGRLANDATDPLERTAFRKIAGRLDKEMLKQMDKPAKAAFKRDLKRWAGNTTYRKAVEKAGNKKGGMFTPDDWLTATPNRKLGKNQGIRQTETQNLQQQLKDIKLAGKTAGRNNPEKAIAAANKVTAAEGLKQAKLEARRHVPKPPNLFRKMAATGLLSLAGAPMGLTGAIGTGAVAANRLAAPSVQRAIAGQSKGYGVLANALRAGTSEPVINAASRGLPAAYGVMQDDEIF